MMDATKYAPGYYPVPAGYDSWVKKDHIEKAPAWCSVDLRDGNQALIVPMSLAEKLEFFQMLVKIGFKEIEVGFPAASDTEYEFLRTLIEKNMIPEDVTVQVLTQCRDHIIRKTFEAVKGAPRAVIHFYNSTSVAQREQVFHKSREEIKKIATDGAKLVKQLSQEYEGNFLFEYSPESFTGTEVDYAVEVCNAVLDIMQPTPDRPMIINLPVTVEMSMPHVYANQIEYCDKHLKYRDSVIISTHPHNDRGTGVACAEMAVLAGAQRVECCLFGNGERTGNVDAVTLAMNLYSHGVDPRLDFSDMPEICATYERVTRMHIYERTPYAGQLVFAAFSGSHQDAIAKGMAYCASVLYKLNSGTDSLFLQFETKNSSGAKSYYGNAFKNAKQDIALDNGWKLRWAAFTATADGYADGLFISTADDNATVTNDLTIMHPMVQMGNAPTAWTASTGDYLTTAETKTEIKQTVSEIKLTASTSGTSSTIKLTAGGTEITSAQINLSGVVTFSDLSTWNQDKTIINGGNITTGQIHNKARTTTYDLDNAWIRMGKDAGTRVDIDTGRIRWYWENNLTGVLSSRYGKSYIGDNSRYTFLGWFSTGDPSFDYSTGGATSEFVGIAIDQVDKVIHCNASKFEIPGRIECGSLSVNGREI